MIVANSKIDTDQNIRLKAEKVLFLRRRTLAGSVPSCSSRVSVRIEGPKEYAAEMGIDSCDEQNVIEGAKLYLG